MDKRWVIIGGGVAGLTAAIALRSRGIKAQVYDRVALLTGIGAGFGLAANAIYALDCLGLKSGVLPLGHYLDSYNILSQDGKVLVAPNTKAISEKYQSDNFAIHRGQLHQYLLAQLDPAQIHTGKEATKLQQGDQHIRIDFADGSSVATDYLLIADGVKSPLRQQLIPSSTPRYAGYTCWRAVIDNRQALLRRSSETWGAKGRFGMTPLVDNKIYWYACINAPQQSSRYAQFTPDDLYHQFKDYHNPIPALIAQTAAEQLLWNDIVDIKPIEQFAFGNILLIGDAAHATTPNLGQGACQALEDIAVLADELQQGDDVAQCFKRVEKRRLARTKYITQTSWRIGKIAQWQNPWLIAMRNVAMRCMPESIKQHTLNALLEEDFMQHNKKNKTHSSDPYEA